MNATQPVDWRRDRVGAARRGQNPTVVARLVSGWAVIGDYQRLPGYCVLLHDGHAEHLTDLTPADQVTFLADMAVLGEAVEHACRLLDPGFARVNYEILGNADPFLHAHVRARYTWEPDHLRRRPVWDYDDLTDPAYALGPQHTPLRRALSDALHATGRAQDLDDTAGVRDPGAVRAPASATA